MNFVDSADTSVDGTADWLGLRDARVLVAGAGGIGASCVAGFRQAGAKVLVVDRDEDALAKLRAEDPGLATLALDLTERGSGTAAVEETLSRLGGLDVLLHCVGVNDRRAVLDFTEEEWDRVLRVNLTSAFGIAQAAGRHMVAQGSGRVLLFSSVSGWLAHALHGPYATSKGGLNQMMRVMAREWAPYGVTVNALAPGYIETNLTAGYLAKPGVRDELTALVPAGRLGQPGEVVGPVLFLSSRHAAFVTGHVLYVDGGRTLV
ncbi:SDR family NAD(P)-dependent oxidoreductase [Nocardioides sp.]|uniref:SDR family NAD(P)-dependent oxidoreductase n=1 Tax=Nocardioides sp. TaxID=35761 RepID=UPI0039E399A3